LKERFGETSKVKRMRVMIFEADPKPKPDEAMRNYMKLIKENRLDLTSIKRKISIYRTCDEILSAVKLLNLFLSS
jgi:hypothetical protein